METPSYNAASRGRGRGGTSRGRGNNFRGRGGLGGLAGGFHAAETAGHLPSGDHHTEAVPYSGRGRGRGGRGGRGGGDLTHRGSFHSMPPPSSLYQAANQAAPSVKHPAVLMKHRVSISADSGFVYPWLEDLALTDQDVGSEAPSRAASPTVSMPATTVVTKPTTQPTTTTTTTTSKVFSSTTTGKVTSSTQPNWRQGPRKEQPPPPAKRKNQKTERRKQWYDEFWTERQAAHALQKSPHNVAEGVLRMSKSRRMAYVVVDGYPRDIAVVGSRDRNRALQGDRVLIHVRGELPPAKFRDENCGSALLEKLAVPDTFRFDTTVDELANANDDDENNDEEEDDDQVPRPIGVVVAIPQRRPGTTYAGRVMPSFWKPGMTDEEFQDLMPVTADAAEGEESDEDPASADSDTEWDDEGVATEADVATSQKAGKKKAEVDDKKKKKANKQNNTKAPHNVYFRPHDSRAPLLLIPRNDLPADLDQEYEKKYADKIFLASLVRWPTTSMVPFGKLERLIGCAGEIAAETEAILDGNCVRTADFSDAVLRCLPDTATAPWSIPAEEVAKRRDLRQSHRIFTIDPETARDLDDAVSCQVLPDGHLLVGVHIADVSHFVRPNTALDSEAQQRATTTYLVQKAIPMLPAVLCENLCSLNPAVDRLAFSVEWKMTADTGEVVETWFGRSVIRSCVKLSYEQAQSLIDGRPWLDAVGHSLPADCGHSEQQIISDVQTFYRLSKIMRKRRFDSGALTINQPKLSFKLTKDTEQPEQCSVYEIRDSNRLFEEFMLLANMSVAKKISEHFPADALLRCHPPPTPKVLKAFLAYTKRLGYQLDGSSAGALQRSIESVGDVEARQILQLLAIKPMQRAQYFCTGQYPGKLARWRHYALNVELYTHFTSPIRRYADVLVHRMLQACLDSEVTEADASNSNDEPPKPILSRADLIKYAAHCNLKKEDARTAQDASARLFLCVYLLQLEASLGRPIIVDGVVMDCGDKTVDVYIPVYAMDRRVFLEDSGALSVAASANRDSVTATWPDLTTYSAMGLPPFERGGDNTTVESVVDGCKVFTFKAAAENGKSVVPQTIRMQMHVKVRLSVLRRSPMDVKACLLHPDFQVVAGGGISSAPVE